MIIDCKNQNIEMYCSDNEIINTEINLENLPFHIRVGMFEGSVEIL